MESEDSDLEVEREENEEEENDEYDDSLKSILRKKIWKDGLGVDYFIEWGNGERFWISKEELMDIDIANFAIIKEFEEKTKKKEIETNERKKNKIFVKNTKSKSPWTQSKTESRTEAQIQTALLDEIVPWYYKPLEQPSFPPKLSPKIVPEQKNIVQNVVEKTKRKIASLQWKCLVVLAENLLLYEGFEEVPMIIKARIFYYLARKKKLRPDEMNVLIDPEQINLDVSSVGMWIVDDHVIPIGERCHKLVRLNLEGAAELTDAGIKSLAKGCPLLTHLNLKGCKNVVNISPLSSNSQLEVLNLSSCISLNTKDMIQFAQNPPRLKEIDISNCKLHPLVLLNLIGFIPLEVLNAINGIIYSDMKIPHFVLSKTNGTLRELKISGDWIKKTLPFNKKGSSNIFKMEIGSFIFNFLIKDISKIELLQCSYLQLSETSTKIDILRKFSNMKTLCMDVWNFKKNQVNNDIIFPNLENLCIVNKILETGFLRFQSPSLKTLTLVKCNLNDENDLKNLILKCPKLIEICFREVKTISLSTLFYILRDGPPLEFFECSNAISQKDEWKNIAWERVKLRENSHCNTFALKPWNGDKGLFNSLLSNFCNLENLHFEDCYGGYTVNQLSDHDFNNLLKKLPKLKSLRLLGLNSIINFMPNMPLLENLKELYISRTTLFEEHLPSLSKQCPNLETIGLQKTYGSLASCIGVIAAYFPSLKNLRLCFNHVKQTDFTPLESVDIEIHLCKCLFYLPQQLSPQIQANCTVLDKMCSSFIPNFKMTYEPDSIL